MNEAGKLPPPLPPRLDWFVQTQVGQLAQGGVPAWFHGAISREDAESLLESQPLGSFLIRVSHSHVGYTLSYKAQSCCRHFMVKLLDDGSFMIPGEERVHASLHALVTFHQQRPMRPHGDLLTQPCGQKDPENVDYEDLFLYSNALTEEVTSPTHGPSKHQNPSSCSTVAPEETSGRPILLHRPKGRRPSAKTSRDPKEEATSSCPPKAPLEEACQKLWRNFRMLPEMGKRVQQQLKPHSAPVNLSSLWNAGPPALAHSSGARPGDTHWEDDVSTAHFAATSLTSPAQSQDLRDGGDPSGKASRLASGSKVTPRVRSWHRVVMRALSSKASKPETEGLAEAQRDWLPEEYLTPPPFAPGYC
ncbi:hematopoietic sh2 domain-containing [Lynx pardinus]|uniref:Hematopoietic sh2 domain-containing n=1 Tax=Lynx pardinus TaxID=191816 RepID=A0A485PNN4_LYNPA|nr:hematopoietic SH2 domain-containing protein isoform X1 [Lynx rufus]XP_046951633.1 hematopoietic SH2 domain-containing protein isoform X1 [Lynx rufus]VFV45236.1 hematopoietic sh2 domain-containing [Lynx pardinus]